MQAFDSPYFTVDKFDRTRFAIFVCVDFWPIQFKHLDFHSFGIRPFASHGAITPDKDTRVSARLDVFPLNVEDEVFILLGTTHHTDGLAVADEHAVFDTPCFWGGVDVDPASEVFAVKERFPFR